MKLFNVAYSKTKIIPKMIIPILVILFFMPTISKLISLLFDTTRNDNLESIGGLMVILFLILYPLIILINASIKVFRITPLIAITEAGITLNYLDNLFLPWDTIARVNTYKSQKYTKSRKHIIYIAGLTLILKDSHSITNRNAGNKHAEFSSYNLEEKYWNISIEELQNIIALNMEIYASTKYYKLNA